MGDVLDYSSIAASMRRRLPQIAALAEQVPYEAQGILYSEILFLLACLEGTQTKRLIESGRARAQSTLLLSLALPDVEIISIELDPNSPDAPFAAERLKDRRNVRLLFGDSRIVVPDLLQEGDVVLIDGPKGFRSIRFALSLLMDGRASQVFLHDLTFGTPKRSFVAANFPEARFSDRRQLAEIGSLADKSVIPQLAAHLQLGALSAEFGYGFGLGVIPRLDGRPYRWLRAKASLAGQIERVGSKLRRRQPK